MAHSFDAQILTKMDMATTLIRVLLIMEQVSETSMAALIPIMMDTAMMEMISLTMRQHTPIVITMESKIQ